MVAKFEMGLKATLTVQVPLGGIIFPTQLFVAT